MNYDARNRIEQALLHSETGKHPTVTLNTRDLRELIEALDQAQGGRPMEMSRPEEVRR